MSDQTPHEPNVLKQMYFLNMLANINASYAALDEKSLNKNVLEINKALTNDVIKSVVGEWEVVWGPAAVNQKYTLKVGLFHTGRWVTDNAMYVAKKKGTDDYFIGISGTNGVSYDGWFKQDFDVSTSVEWPPEYLKLPPVASGHPRISQAGQTGLEVLWTMTPTKPAKRANESLINFLLNTCKNRACTISVGGHSLGGCLAPLLATAIADRMQGISGYAGVKLCAYPTAGPTPGNQDFANHLQEQVSHYHAVYNANDPVPLAWDFIGIEALKKSYARWEFGGDKIDPSHPLIHNFLYWATEFAAPQNYTRFPKITGSSFKVSIWSNARIAQVDDPKKNIKTMIKELVELIEKFKGTDSASKLVKNIQYIAGNNDERRDNVRLTVFFRFLFQVLLQHVSAYNHPITADGSVPWQVTPTEKGVLKEFLTPPQPDTLTKAWLGECFLKILADLSGMAVDWLKEHPEAGHTRTDAAIVASPGATDPSLAVEDAEPPDLEALHSASAEALDFLLNPYGRMFS